MKMRRYLSIACAFLAAVVILPHRLSAAGRTEESAVTPEGGNDARQKQFIERGKDKDIKLVFLGDSITDFWMGTGKKVWDEYYKKYDAADFGVSGEHTEHVLGRIEHGLLDDVKPKVVVIMIGTNNIGHSAEEKPEWTAAGVKKIVEKVHEKLPDAKVLLLGVFPRDAKDSSSRKKVEEINEIISKLDDGPTDAEVKAEADRIWTTEYERKIVIVGGQQVNLKQVQADFNADTRGLKEKMRRRHPVKTYYLDIGPKFLDEKGELPNDIMPDKLHPTEKGYKIWAEAMQPLLDEMMK